MSTKSNSQKNKELLDHNTFKNPLTTRIFWMVASFWLLIVLVIYHPYFLYGESSAIGWYDELDLPIALQGLITKGAYQYSQEFAGGTYIDQAFSPFANLNLLSILVAAFDEWLAYAIYKIMWPLFGGWFILYYLLIGKPFPAKTSQNTHHNSTITIALLVSSVTALTLISPAIYGWTPGFGPIVFLYLIIAILIADGRLLKDRPVLYWGALVLGGFVKSISLGSLTVFLPALIVFSACLWICLETRRELVKSVSGLVVVVIATVLFSFNELKVVLELSSSGEYSRFLKKNDDLGIHHFFPDAPSLNKWQLVLGYFARGSSSPFDVVLPRGFANAVWFVLIGFLVVAANMFWTRRWNALASLFLIIVATPITATIFHFMGLMEAYRFNPITKFLLHGLVLIVIIELNSPVQTVVNHSRKRKYLGRNILFVIFISSFSWLNITAFLNFSARTYYNIIFKGDTWNRYAEKSYDFFEDGYKAMSLTPYNPRSAFGLRLGLAMFDGMRQNFTVGRTNFFFYALANDPKSVHTHRHSFFGIDHDKIDEKMLRLANVKYLISFLQIDHDFKLDIPVNKCPDVFPCQIYFDYFGKPDLYDTVYVKELKNVWPFVYQARSLTQSGYTYNHKNYFRELKQLIHCSALLQSDQTDHTLYSYAGENILAPCQPLKYYFNHDTLTIMGIKQGRAIVVNHEYIEGMKAYCDDTPIPIQTVNAIHTLLPIQEMKCETARIVY